MAFSTVTNGHMSRRVCKLLHIPPLHFNMELERVRHSHSYWTMGQCRIYDFWHGPWAILEFHVQDQARQQWKAVQIFELGIISSTAGIEAAVCHCHWRLRNRNQPYGRQIVKNRNCQKAETQISSLCHWQSLVHDSVGRAVCINPPCLKGWKVDKSRE